MKRGEYILLFVLVVVLMTSIVSAGFSEWFKKITGQASEEASIDMNISVGTGTAPAIFYVYKPASVTLLDGASSTNVSLNFSVTDADGFGNLNPSSAALNVSYSGVSYLNNSACAEFQTSGNYANYTCNITMWWWDKSAEWDINFTIQDDNTNQVSNDTDTLSIASVLGFVSGPGNISWGTLQPNTNNQTPNDWVVLNHTGNQNVSTSHIQINATDLKGETTPSLGIWASNFSVGTTTGAGNPECDSSGGTATNMTNGTSGDSLEPVIGSFLNPGNFTVNTNETGQEVLYLCIQKVGLGLISQRYSTDVEGPWTIKII